MTAKITITFTTSLEGMEITNQSQLLANIAEGEGYWLEAIYYAKDLTIEGVFLDAD